MKEVGKWAKKLFAYVEILRFEIYGKPTDTVPERMIQIVGYRIEVNIGPQIIGVYIRFKSG